MHNHILLPIDGDPGTEQAIAYTIATADEVGATVHALYVIKESVYGSYDGDKKMQAEIKRDGRDALKQVRVAARPTDVLVETALRYGPPTTEILAAAQDVDADAIVMPTHGRTGLDRLLMGSLAESVIRRATIPVTTVTAHDESPSIETPDAAIELARAATE